MFKQKLNSLLLSVLIYLLLTTMPRPVPRKPSPPPVPPTLPAPPFASPLGETDQLNVVDGGEGHSYHYSQGYHGNHEVYYSQAHRAATVLHQDMLYGDQYYGEQVLIGDLQERQHQHQQQQQQQLYNTVVYGDQYFGEQLQERQQQQQQQQQLTYLPSRQKDPSQHNLFDSWIHRDGLPQQQQQQPQQQQPQQQQPQRKTSRKRKHDDISSQIDERKETRRNQYQRRRKEQSQRARKNKNNQAQMEAQRANPEVRAREAAAKAEQRANPEVRAREAAAKAEQRANPEVREQHNELNRRSMTNVRANPDYVAREQQQQHQYNRQPQRMEAQRQRDRRRRLDPELRQRRAERERRRRRDLGLPITIANQCNLDHWTSVDVPKFSAGPMNVECIHCQARGFEGENQGTQRSPHFGIQCCNQNKNVLEQHADWPEALLEYYTANTPKAKRFRKMIRKFNGELAFGSLQVKDSTVSGYGSSAAFTATGQMYRRIGSMLRPTNETEYSCMQCWFHDNDQDAYRAARRRAVGGLAAADRTPEEELDRIIFSELREILENCPNEMLQSLKTIKDFIEEHNLNPDELQIALHNTEAPRGIHPGRYHLPSVKEMSLLIPTTIPETVAERSVVCNVRGDNNRDSLQIIPEHHHLWEPIGYPLLFPHGQPKWGTSTRSNTTDTPEGTVGGVKIQLAPYVRYHSRQRLRKNLMSYGNKLWQQYILDQYARQESMRLNYIRNNQKKLRADVYKNVQDAVRRDDVENSGRVTILPASFTGSDRWYHKYYRNAMSLVRVFGKPTLFVTYTLDVNCEEIKENLHPYQTPYDRPELLNQVFHVKKKQLIDDVVKGGIFGNCIAHVAVVEFQKRGAPHAHCLFWIEDFDSTPSGVDGVISAELPHPDDPLHQLVVDKMTHGPCGRQFNNTHFSCCDGLKPDATKCNKDYPKDFRYNTVLEDDSFPQYRRRSPEDGGYTGTKIMKGGITVTITNEWVVPYSPFLLARYGSHINVEFVNTVKTVKYLFKYVTKGEDRVTAEERFQFDEVSKFQDARYIAATYAHFRLAEYKQVKVCPPVQMLPLHLQNEQMVVHGATRDAAAEALARNKRTMLTEYFATNADPEHAPFANTLKYEEFPKFFAWKQTERKWARRQTSQFAIGRMVSIYPTQNDIFYLRLLLKHVTGATSFQHLRTVNGVVYPTFKAACVRLELCEDDSQWISCLDEAANMMMPVAMRNLFANILMHCHPTDAQSLLDRFKESMSEDFLKKYLDEGQHPEEDAIRFAHNDLLLALNTIVKEEKGVTIGKYHITEPDEDLRGVTEEEPIREDIDPNAQAYVDANLELMNDGQAEVYDAILRGFEDGSDKLFRIDAPGGTGKTFVSNLLLSSARVGEGIALATALSGIAATLLIQGTTFHKRFVPPIPCLDDSSSGVRLDSKEARAIKVAQLIIIDEVSMMSRKLLNMLDRFLRELMDSDECMGGKKMVLLHDFRQVLPVVPQGRRADIVADTVLRSHCWSKFKKLELTTNMRVQKQIEKDPTRASELRRHADWLLSIGNGTAETKTQNLVEIPQQMVCDTVETLEERVYDNFLENHTDPDYLKARAIMSATNNTIQERNFEMVKRLPGDLVVSYSRDSCTEEEHQALYDGEILNKYNTSGIPPHRLALKKGACIILIKNLNVRRGHVNGTRYIIEDLTTRVILAKRLSDGEQYMIPRIPMISKDSDFPVPFKRVQFPVLVSYYLSIHRAQGQSLDKAGVYLPSSVFSHGSLYVALSRSGDPDKTFVFADQDEYFNLADELEDGKTYTRNVVYREVLDDG